MKVQAFELPPPGLGFWTVTASVAEIAVSEFARSEAGTVTVIDEAVAADGVSVVPPKLTLLAKTKLEPPIVKVKALEPASTDTGDIEPMAGVALVTLRTAGIDAPPPGVGFVTVT